MSKPRESLVMTGSDKADIAQKKDKKNPAEEAFKTEKHPLDCWENILGFARNGSGPPDKAWSFRLRWFGLFWEGPRSDTFMLRLKVNGGQISAAQLRGIADLTDACALPFLNVTTRQGIQIRGIPVAHVPPIFKELEALGLTSMQSGADNVRNLTACAQAGIAPNEIADVSALARTLKTLFVGNRAFADLPRKFNISLAGCGTNCTHPELHDIAVQAVRDGAGDAVGYGIRVGGQPSTSHFVSQDLEVLLTEEEVPEVCAAIVAVYRDHGDRTNRKQARMGHLLEKWGMPRFRESVEHALGRPLPRHISDAAIREQEQDPIGIHPQKQDGLSFVGLPFPVGKVTVDQARALARLSEEFGSGELRTSNRQNILLINIPNERLDHLTAELDRAGIPYGGSPLQAAMTACSGNTYCKLATVETKNRVVNIVESLEREGLDKDPLNIALSACPNTCANHSVADIGLQGCKIKVDGETVEAFHVFFGGGTGDSTAFGKHALRRIPGDRINAQLAYAVRVYRKRRQGDESFKSFCERYTAEEMALLFKPWTYPTSRPVRWLAERIARIGGDELSTYV
ncbi:MAG: nitrite/sulfite reductase [Leptospirillia bacterium]